MNKNHIAAQSKALTAIELQQKIAIQAGHIGALQAARGVAATVVLLHHCLVVFPLAGPLAGLAAASEWFAHWAVVFFFVLSGYVLGLSLLRRPQPAWRFYIRRAFRIVPAAWAATTLALLVIWLFYRPVPGTTDWFGRLYPPEDYDLKHVVASYLLIDLYLVQPVWTIFVELSAAIFVPALIIVTRNGWVSLALLICSVALTVLWPGKFYVGVYLCCFVFGVICARSGSVLRPQSNLLAIPLFFAIWITARIFFGWPYHSPAMTVLEAAMSATIVLVLAANSQTNFSRGPIAWLGDISYSLYLLHFPILSLFVFILGTTGVANGGKFLLVLACTVPTTLAAATLSYNLVEVPSIRLGKLLSPPASSQR